MRVRVSTAISEAKQLRLTGGQCTHIDFRCGDRASATFLRDSSAITASTRPWLGLQKPPSYEAFFVLPQAEDGYWLLLMVAKDKEHIARKLAALKFAPAQM